MPSTVNTAPDPNDPSRSHSAASTAVTPSASPATCLSPIRTPNTHAATTAVSTGVQEMINAVTDAGTPSRSPRYTPENWHACTSNPATHVWTSGHPRGQRALVTRATSAMSVAARAKRIVVIRNGGATATASAPTG